MAFESRELSVLAYANGFTLWHYRTADRLPDLMDGYFAPACELLRPGDQITVNLMAGSRIDLAHLVIRAVTADAVTAAPLLASVEWERETRRAA